MKPLLFAFVLTFAAHAAASHTMRTVKSARPHIWEAKVSYPHFNGSSALVKLANAQALSAARKILDDFLEMARPQKGDPTYENPAVLDSTCKVGLETSQLISIKFFSEVDVHAAHPGDYGTRLNFGIVDGKPKKLKLSDITDSPKSLTRQIMSQIWQQLREANLYSHGVVSSLSKDELEHFFEITPNGLTFVYEKGELLGRAFIGTVAEIPWRSIKGLKRKGAVRPLLTTRPYSRRRTL